MMNRVIPAALSLRLHHNSTADNPCKEWTIHQTLQYLIAMFCPDSATRIIAPKQERTNSRTCLLHLKLSHQSSITAVWQEQDWTKSFWTTNIHPAFHHKCHIERTCCRHYFPPVRLRSAAPANPNTGAGCDYFITCNAIAETSLW